MITAIIPARGGSKGVPRKNVRNLGSRPLIAWTIRAARMSMVDRVIVSTEDQEIAEVSKRYGAEVIQRPPELAIDTAQSIDVILHAMDIVPGDIIAMLFPTAPLRTPEDINQAIDLLSYRKAQAIVSVCEVEHHPLWCGTLPYDNNMGDFLKPSVANSNRQTLPKYYRVNGSIYLAHRGYIKERHSFFGDKTYAYIMPQERSVNIDTERDFRLVEYEYNLSLQR